jgi:LysM repeat protein
VVTPPVDTAPPPTTTVEHTIVRGDNFSTLATKYGVSVKAIQDANPNLQPTRLKIGDKGQDSGENSVNGCQWHRRQHTTAAASDTYTVKSGDTLSKVAKDHGTSVKELQRLNNLTTTQIRVGQKLKLPQRAAAPAGGVAPAP